MPASYPASIRDFPTRTDGQDQVVYADHINQVYEEVEAILQGLLGPLGLQHNVWLKGPQPWADVKAYGAVGDGVTNDAVAIQAAANAVGSPDGGIVLLEPKSYNLGTTQLSLQDNVVLIGAGARKDIDGKGTELLYSGTDYAIISAAGSGRDGGGLRRLRIQITAAALGCVKIADPANHWVLEDLELRGAGTASGLGLLLQGQTTCNCHHRIDTASFVNLQTGIRFSGHANANHLSNLHFGSLAIGARFEALGTDTQGGDKNVFIACAFESGVVTAVKIVSPSFDNLFLGCHSDGVTTSVDIAGGNDRNRFVGCEWDAAVTLAGSAVSSTVFVATRSPSGVPGTDARFLQVPVLTTAALPAAGSAEDGRVVIENVGAGDRNLIIYAGSQRFRLDGGAAF